MFVCRNIGMTRRSAGVSAHCDSQVPYAVWSSPLGDARLHAASAQWYLLLLLPLLLDGSDQESDKSLAHPSAFLTQATNMPSVSGIQTQTHSPATKKRGDLKKGTVVSTTSNCNSRVSQGCWLFMAEDAAAETAAAAAAATSCWVFCDRQGVRVAAPCV